MASSLVNDELWISIEPLLPKSRPKPKGGRPEVPARDCLAGIIFILRTGVPWNSLPTEFGCGSGNTCWRRLRDWTVAGIWPQVLKLLQDALGRLGQIDWSRAILDSASVRAVFGGPTRAETPQTEPKRAANGT